MPGLVEAATAIMRSSERRLAVISQNVSNISTPGYKRQVSFEEMADVSREAAAATSPHAILSRIGTAQNAEEGVASQIATLRRATDSGAGALRQTAAPLDLAIAGSGYFQVRVGDAMGYTRQGQFALDADGRLIAGRNMVLQQAGGGDLILTRSDVEILADGTILDAGLPVARIALFAPEDGTDFANDTTGTWTTAAGGKMREVDDVQLRQGMLEDSNVTLGDEMIGVMAAMRQAESGARLIQTYDDLMGRVISVIGERGQ